MKRALALGVLALLAATPAAARTNTAGTLAATPAKIVFVDVGQGDGVIIKVGGRIIVSDAGLPGRADEMDAALENLGANHHIDVAILSHAHLDHIGGFRGLVEDFDYEIEKAVLAPHPYYQDGTTNRAILRALTEQGTEIIEAKTGDVFTWGGASWRILSPPAGAFASSGGEANASLVFRLRTRGSDLLFSGDIEKDAEEGVIDAWTFGQAEILLVTHHGSNLASSTALLAKISPRFAVLSTGKNSHGHPGLSAIGRLQAAGAMIFCTDTNGTLTATLTSGAGISWQASKPQQAPWWSPPDGESGTCVGR